MARECQSYIYIYNYITKFYKVSDAIKATD